jgi:hypothetical protein
MAVASNPALDDRYRSLIRDGLTRPFDEWEHQRVERSAPYLKDGVKQYVPLGRHRVGAGMHIRAKRVDLG